MTVSGNFCVALLIGLLSATSGQTNDAKSSSSPASSSDDQGATANRFGFGSFGGFGMPNFYPQNKPFGDSRRPLDWEGRFPDPGFKPGFNPSQQDYSNSGRPQNGGFNFENQGFQSGKRPRPSAGKPEKLVEGGQPPRLPLTSQIDGSDGGSQGFLQGGLPQSLQPSRKSSMQQPGRQTRPTTENPREFWPPNLAEMFQRPPNSPNSIPITEDTFEESPPVPPFIKLQDEAAKKAREEGRNINGGIFFPESNSGRLTSAGPSPGPVTFPPNADDESTTQTATTPSSGGGGPAPTTETSQCELDCQSTFEFNPVCGSDGQNYNNPGRLRCANNCGKSLTISYYGRCRMQ